MVQQFRFVIVTPDGKRYAARWRNSVVEASDAADELVLRRGLLVGHFVGHVRGKETTWEQS